MPKIPDNQNIADILCNGDYLKRLEMVRLGKEMRT